MKNLLDIELPDLIDDHLRSLKHLENTLTTKTGLIYEDASITIIDSILQQTKTRIQYFEDLKIKTAVE